MPDEIIISRQRRINGKILKVDRRFSEDEISYCYIPPEQLIVFYFNSLKEKLNQATRRRGNEYRRNV